MLTKVEQEVSILAIIATPSFVPIEVCQDLNVPLADTRTTFPKVVVSTTEVFLAVIVPVSLPEVIIFMVTSKPYEVAPIDLQVLTNVFLIILVAKAVLAAFTQESI